MKRKTESPMEFPLLEVIAFPADPIPVSVIVTGDFEITGDINLSLGATADQLRDIKRLLEFVQEALADEIYLREVAVNPPWSFTGGNVSKDTPSE